jgi:uncharacterized membrane protein
VTRALTQNTVIRPLNFPSTAQELRRDYDVVWLAGFNNYWREAPDTVTASIVAAVNAGATFVHSGSAGSFHGGGNFINKAAGLDLTALADVLPVVVRHDNDAYFKSTFRAGSLANPFAQPKQLHLAATEKAPRWLQQADLSGGEVDDFHVLAAKPDSDVLVELGDLPLLVSGRYGKGRTIAYMGFSPEGSPKLDHSPIIIDRALKEGSAQRTFGIMTAVILTLASAEDPPVSVDSLIEERARPVFEPFLASDPAPPSSVQVKWSQGANGASVGHVRIENGDQFNYGLRVRLSGPDEHADHTLALWGNQFFDLLPHEVAETDVTVVRSTTATPDRLWITAETIGGRKAPHTELEVPL